jgi:F-type H+-transporting ATPase subunit b
MNWWKGILMVNNEAAEKGGFVNELLFRYENPKDPCDHKNLPPPFLASLLNFGVLAFVLYRFGKKPLAEALVARKKTIMAEIDQATKLKEDAEDRLEEYEEKLENIEAKLEEVRADYRAQAEVEKKHILAEAEERRARMRRDAEFRIDQEMKAMRDELLREAVANAVVAAEELIAKNVTATDNDKMAADYLKSVGAALAAGGRS